MTVSEMPSHTHGILLNQDGSSASGGFWGYQWQVHVSTSVIPPPAGAGYQNFMTNQPTGGGVAFNNMQPSIALLYCIKD
jgi:microcystin-dependent protein